MRKSTDTIVGFFFIFVGSGAMIGAIGLQLGQAHDPKPGFLPFIDGVALTILSAILIIKAWRGDTTGVNAFGNLWRPAMLITGLVIYISISNLMGFIIATTILSVIILRIMETKSWWVVAVGSLTMAIGSYLLFDRLLEVTLPAGILARLG